jgi:hypothetical protein
MVSQSFWDTYVGFAIDLLAIIDSIWWVLMCHPFSIFSLMMARMIED